MPGHWNAGEPGGTTARRFLIKQGNDKRGAGFALATIPLPLKREWVDDFID